MASTHAVQIQTQGGHGQASASDLIFLVVCGEERIVPCLPKQASGVWCVSLYTVRQGEVCMVYKYARACHTALIAQLYRRQRWHQIALCKYRRFFQNYTIAGSGTGDQETPTNWFRVTKHALDAGNFVHTPPQKLSWHRGQHFNSFCI